MGTAGLVRGLGPHEGEGSPPAGALVELNHSKAKVFGLRNLEGARCTIRWSSTQVESRRPLRGVCRGLEIKARARHGLASAGPSHSVAPPLD